MIRALSAVSHAVFEAVSGGARIASVTKGGVTYKIVKVSQFEFNRMAAANFNTEVAAIAARKSIEKDRIGSDFLTAHIATK